MRKNYSLKSGKKGYSLIVLIIAIIVIIILASVAISSLSNSRQKNDIRNFIYDLNSVEEKVQAYYIQNNSLPTSSKNEADIKVDINALIDNAELNGDYDFRSQLSQYDNDNYYYIDLSRLDRLSLKDPYRSNTSGKCGYIVNEGSLKVYVEKGVSYKVDNTQNPIFYHTLTSNLVNGQEVYLSQDEEIKVLNNPLTWVNQAELRIVLPRKSLSTSDLTNWTFRWDYGTKTAEELEQLPENKYGFKYGNKLLVKRNGIYSILVKSPEGESTVLRVNVDKVDDIAPKYSFASDGNTVTFIDNETGIRNVYYKKLSTYQTNFSNATDTQTPIDLEARNKIDYYQIGGNGFNLIMELGAQIIEYANRVKEIKEKVSEENIAWKEIDDYYKNIAEVSSGESEGIDEDSIRQWREREKEHNDIIASYNNELNLLNKQYPYLYDIDGNGDNSQGITAEDSRLVVFIEDYAENGTVVGDDEKITTRMLANSYNISLEPLNGLFD